MAQAKRHYGRFLKKFKTARNSQALVVSLSCLGYCCVIDGRLLRCAGTGDPHFPPPWLDHGRPVAELGQDALRDEG